MVTIILIWTEENCISSQQSVINELRKTASVHKCLTVEAVIKLVLDPGSLWLLYHRNPLLTCLSSHEILVFNTFKTAMPAWLLKKNVFNSIKRMLPAWLKKNVFQKNDAHLTFMKSKKHMSLHFWVTPYQWPNASGIKFKTAVLALCSLAGSLPLCLILSSDLSAILLWLSYPEQLCVLKANFKSFGQSSSC